MGNGKRIVLRDADLPFLPALYAQPGQDDGTVQSMEEAGPVFARIKTYPAYRIYVARKGRRIVGCFALLIMDNIGHKGAPSAVLEDVGVEEGFGGARSWSTDDDSYQGVLPTKIPFPQNYFQTQILRLFHHTSP
jgi:hypothetical protein